MRSTVIDTLKEGVSQSETARLLSLPRRTVWRIAKDNGISPVSRTVTTGQIDRVFEMRDQGRSVAETAIATGLSEKKVRDIYVNVNAKTYKRSWWQATPEKRTAVLKQLDDGKTAREVAKQQQLPLETVRGIANQHRMARDSLVIELMSGGESVDQIATKLGISSNYVKRVKQRGISATTHDIKDSSEDVAQAMELFANGQTREQVAERLGISGWQAHRLANAYREKTMDSVMPQQLLDVVRALDRPDRLFTTGELARGSRLPESTVALIEEEFGMGSFIRRSVSPQAGTSDVPAPHKGVFEWVRPLTQEQEIQVIRAMDAGKDLRPAATELNVRRQAIERLYDPDLPLVAPLDEPVVPRPAVAGPSGVAALSEADRLEVRKLSMDSGLSAEFIANLLELPLDAVNKALA